MSQDGYEEMSMRAQQTKRPICVLITGRPGSGKSTLADILSKQLYLPKISRDEFKEGYVNTFGVRHDALPPDTNGVVNQVFFQTILNMLDGNVSLLIEAAFAHALWGHVVPDIMARARLFIVVCDLDAERSARRHLERGLANPKREFYHGDKRVSVFRETGRFEPGGEYIAPTYNVPTLAVSTADGYHPSLDEVVSWIADNGSVNQWQGKDPS